MSESTLIDLNASSKVTLQSDINGRTNVLSYIKAYFGEFAPHLPSFIAPSLI